MYIGARNHRLVNVNVNVFSILDTTVFFLVIRWKCISSTIIIQDRAMNPPNYLVSDPTLTSYPILTS
jgi:hypothetical protein